MRLLRRFICNKETPLTEKGKIWEEMIENPDYMALVDLAKFPEVGLPIDNRFFKNKWFTELESIPIKESKWWPIYEKNVKNKIITNNSNIKFYTKLIQQAEQDIKVLEETLL